jgi:hypothetical protein
MLDEAREDREDELEARDREGEKAPAEDATFGGRGPVGFIGPGPLVGYVIEPKDATHVPPEVAARQEATYRELLGVEPDPYPRRFSWAASCNAAMALLRGRR